MGIGEKNKLFDSYSKRINEATDKNNELMKSIDKLKIELEKKDFEIKELKNHTEIIEM